MDKEKEEVALTMTNLTIRSIYLRDQYHRRKAERPPTR
jgi:hypothetical protein